MIIRHIVLFHSLTIFALVYSMQENNKTTMELLFATINNNISHYFGPSGISLTLNNDHCDIAVDQKLLQDYLPIPIKGFTWDTKKQLQNSAISQTLDMYIINEIKDTFALSKTYDNCISIVSDLLLIHYDMTYLTYSNKNKFLVIKTIVNEKGIWKNCLIKKIASILHEFLLFDTSLPTQKKADILQMPAITYREDNDMDKESSIILLKYVTKHSLYQQDIREHSYYTDELNYIAKNNNFNDLKEALNDSLLDFYHFYKNSSIDKLKLYVYHITFTPLQNLINLKKNLPPWCLLVDRFFVCKRQGDHTEIPDLKTNQAMKNFMEEQTLSFQWIFEEKRHRNNVAFCSMRTTHDYFTNCIQKFIRMKKRLGQLKHNPEVSIAKNFFQTEYALIARYKQLYKELLEHEHQIKAVPRNKYKMKKIYLLLIFTIVIFVVMKPKLICKNLKPDKL